MPDPQQTQPVPVVNKPGQEAVDVVETLLKDGEQAAEAAIITDVPFMGAPVWKQVWEAIFDWLLGTLMVPVAQLGGRVVISIEEYTALKTAVAAQTALDAAKKKGDPNAISQASQAVDAAVAGVIHYVGAVKP